MTFDTNDSRKCALIARHDNNIGVRSSRPGPAGDNQKVLWQRIAHCYANRTETEQRVDAARAVNTIQRFSFRDTLASWTRISLPQTSSITVCHNRNSTYSKRM